LNGEPRTVLLPDGRQVFLRECGDPAGKPVLYCHGAPGSSRSINARMADIAARLAARLIIPHRPGYAGSVFRSTDSLLDWPRDVAIIMDRIGVESFSVLGYSMGGLHALACARALPTRTKRIALVASVAPDMLGADILPNLPMTLAQTLRTAHLRPDNLETAVAATGPQQLFAALTAPATEADKLLLADPDTRDGLLDDCIASLNAGGVGMVQDFKLAASDSSFVPEEITQPVSLWHGTGDGNVPFATSATLARRLPRGTLAPLANQGHLCLLSHWEPILADLLIGELPTA
jgi:pimeloyl-ACP methyl ester carboxylesterase